MITKRKWKWWGFYHSNYKRIENVIVNILSIPLAAFIVYYTTRKYSNYENNDKLLFAVIMYLLLYRLFNFIFWLLFIIIDLFSPNKDEILEYFEIKKREIDKRWNSLTYDNENKEGLLKEIDEIKEEEKDFEYGRKMLVHYGIQRLSWKGEYEKSLYENLKKIEDLETIIINSYDENIIKKLEEYKKTRETNLNK